MKTIIRFFITTLSVSILTSCSSVKITDQKTYSTPAIRPQIIYVANFDLQTSDVHSETGILGIKIRPLHHVRELLERNSDNPDVIAIKLVNAMADSIVSNLVATGFPAQRIAPNASVPTNGWVVRGVFTQVDEGNRLRRAFIGFGQGKTDLQVVTAVDDLADGPPAPLYQVKTEATSGNAPGAGPLIVINPATVAVRFAMTGSDLKHNVTETAAQIASRVTEQFAPKN